MSVLGNHDELADAIIDLVYRVLGRHDVPVAKVYSAVWQNANAGDALLSDILFVVGNTTVKGVPQIGTTSFVANDPVLVIKGPGVAWTIIGKVNGDITAAL